MNEEEEHKCDPQHVVPLDKFKCLKDNKRFWTTRLVYERMIMTEGEDRIKKGYSSDPACVQPVQCRTVLASASVKHNDKKQKIPNVGIEPTTTRLRVVRSTN